MLWLFTKSLVATENNMKYPLLDIRDTALVKYTSGMYRSNIQIKQQLCILETDMLKKNIYTITFK